MADNQCGSDLRPSQNTAVVGLQWGDEGKGKVVDFLTSRHDVVVRYNGGANAGHTVVIGDQRYALHLLPSGILSEHIVNVIGNGVVVDPEVLVDEIDALVDRGITVSDNLRISDRAHVVMPYHKDHDAAFEALLAGAKSAGGDDRSIGTTKRGIGPTYADKVLRSTALRVGDLLKPDYLRSKIRMICDVRGAEMQALKLDVPPLNPEKLTDQALVLGQRIQPYVTDTVYWLHDARNAGKSILFEGANACLLDIDHGTYPFVTSSNCSTLGIPAGTGLPGKCIDKAVGIMKAYCTRVGGGPFPTEQTNATGDRIRERGQEYGTTTGRPRRCGWLDVVAIRYTSMICGVTSLAVMLLDVLSTFSELKICTYYRLPDGSTTDRFIPDADRLSQVEPVYETLPGWDEEIDEARIRDDLPENAQQYVHRLEELIELPVEIVSVGPKRSQTLVNPSLAPCQD